MRKADATPCLLLRQSKPAHGLGDSKIQKLLDLEGYLNLAGDWPVIKVRVPLPESSSDDPLASSWLRSPRKGDVLSQIS